MSVGAVDTTVRGDVLPSRSACFSAAASCGSSTIPTRHWVASWAARSCPDAAACASSTRRKSRSKRSTTAVLAPRSARSLRSRCSSADCHHAYSSSPATCCSGTCRTERSRRSGSRPREANSLRRLARSMRFSNTSDSAASPARVRTRVFTGSDDSACDPDRPRTASSSLSSASTRCQATATSARPSGMSGTTFAST